MHGLRARGHSESGKQSDEPEAVVAMEVRNEDIVQPCRARAETRHGDLDAFAAVNHERLVTQFKDLPCGRVGLGGFCAAAT